jgi:hypothetical protein
VLIALGSPLLETMFDFNKQKEEVEMNTVGVGDVPSEAFEQLLTYFYLKSVNLTGETVLAVLETGL